MDASPAPDATTLPALEGVRLDGTPAAFPADFAAPATLVVLTFQDDAAARSGQWARLAGHLGGTAGGLDVLEVSVLPRRMRLLGELPLLGAKARAESQGSTRTSAVVYAKRKPLRKALGIRSESDITAFLVRPDGQIVWRGDGEIDLHEVEALEAAVRDLVSAAQPDAQ